MHSRGLSLVGVQRSDWVYVNNFDTPHRPIALQLSAGRGATLRADMRALIDELRSTIPAAFESEEYAAELERLNTDFKEHAEHGLGEIGDEAQQRGLSLSDPEARKIVYGMPYDEWKKKYQKEASPDQLKTLAAQGGPHKH